MEENNDILLAGGDALVYLAGPMHKKYSATFVWFIERIKFETKKKGGKKRIKINPSGRVHTKIKIRMFRYV